MNLTSTDRKNLARAFLVKSSDDFFWHYCQYTKKKIKISGRMSIKIYAIIQPKNIDIIALIHALGEFRKHTRKNRNN